MKLMNSVTEIYRLHIKQPPSRTSIEGHESEPEWAEYKIKESNMFTVDKYQQVTSFTFFKNYTHKNKIYILKIWVFGLEIYRGNALSNAYVFSSDWIIS